MKINYILAKSRFLEEIQITQDQPLGRCHRWCVTKGNGVADSMLQYCVVCVGALLCTLTSGCGEAIRASELGHASDVAPDLAWILPDNRRVSVESVLREHAVEFSGMEMRVTLIDLPRGFGQHPARFHVLDHFVYNQCLYCIYVYGDELQDRPDRVLLYKVQIDNVSEVYGGIFAAIAALAEHFVTEPGNSGIVLSSGEMLIDRSGHGYWPVGMLNTSIDRIKDTFGSRPVKYDELLGERMSMSDIKNHGSTANVLHMEWSSSGIYSGAVLMLYNMDSALMQ